jgi:hypothetical protein
MTAALLLAAALDVQVGLGGAHALDAAQSSYPFAAPTLHFRAAADFEHVAVGGSFLAVVDGEAPNSVACCDSSGSGAFEAVAGFASVRLHTSGTWQFWGEGSAGFGHLISLQTDNPFEHTPLRGHGGPAYALGVGVRRVEARWPLMEAGLCWVTWTHVEESAHPAGTFEQPFQSGLTTSALLLLLSVGWSFGR